MAAILSRPQRVSSSCSLIHHLTGLPFLLCCIPLFLFETLQTVVLSFWHVLTQISLIARFMGPTWGPPGATRTKVGPMLGTRILLSGILLTSTRSYLCKCTMFRKCGRQEPLGHSAWKWLLDTVAFLLNLEKMAPWDFEIFINHGFPKKCFFSRIYQAAHLCAAGLK